MKRTRRYWLRLLGIAIVAVGLPILLVPSAFGAFAMWALTHPGCGDGGQKPAVEYKEITIPAKNGGGYRGFFLPGTNTAIIIVPPPYNSGRGGMLHEAQILARAGYNVLLYESRICAGKNVISLGYAEVDDVADMLTYLKQDPDGLKINVENIALHGFSSAGATSTMAAARYPEIRVLLAEGGYHDMERLVSPHGSFFEQMIGIGAQIAYWIGTGSTVDTLSPLEAITHVPPRPIFLVYGTAEPSLPGAREQLADVLSSSPGAFIRLWEVPGATHGGYLASVGEAEYTRHVVSFYDCALLKHCEAWDALWKTS